MIVSKSLPTGIKIAKPVKIDTQLKDSLYTWVTIWVNAILVLENIYLGI